jgi:uncharacterized protein YjbI with pentapeptide repeats
MPNLLKKRWHAKEGVDAVREINQALLHEGDIGREMTPFDPIDGLIDLRGFAFRENAMIKACKLEHVDFSYVKLSNTWIENCLFLNVRFDKANLSQISDHGNSFEKCSF